MSAMLEFYDDGEECDDKTEEDLIFLKDTSTNFVLSVITCSFRNILLNFSNIWLLKKANTLNNALKDF